ncbi:MAG: hypothetical protein RTV31_15895 [Candidatus Thorarchaeota archaeon]
MSDEYNDEFLEESTEEDTDTPSDEIGISENNNDEPPKGTKDLLGTSESELDIYSLVITYGNATLGDLVLLSKGMSIEQIQSQIDSLKEKNMIVELPGLVPRFQAVPPFDGLAEEVSQVSDRIHSLRDELKEQVRKASTAVRDTLIDISRQNVDSLSTLKRESASTKTSSLEHVNSKTGIWEASNETTRQEFIAESTGLVSTWKESTSNILDETKGKLVQISSVSGDKLKQTFKSTQTSIEESIDAFQNDLTSSLSSLESTTRGRIEEKSNIIESQLNQEKDSISSRINDIETNVTSSIDNVNQSVMRALDITTEDVSNAIAEGKTQATDLVNSSGSSISNQYSTLEQEFDAALREKATEEEALVHQHGTELDQAYTAMKTRQNVAIQNLEIQLDDTQSQLLSSTETILQSVSDKVEEIDSHSKTAVDGTMRVMKNVANTSIQKYHESLKQYTSEVTQETHSIMDLRKEKLKSSLQQMLASIQTTVSEEIESITRAVDELSIKIDTSYHGMITAMNSNAEQSNQDLEKKLSDLSQEAASTITQASGEATNSLNQLRNDLQAAIQMSKTVTSNTSSEFKDSATDASEIFSETKNSLIESTTSKLQQINTSLLERVSTIVGEGRTRFEEQTGTIISELQESLDGTSEKITSYVESSKSSIGDAFTAASLETRSSLTQSIDSLTTKVDEIQKIALNTVSSLTTIVSEHKAESASKIQTSMSSLVSGAEALMTTGSLEVDGTIGDMTSKVESTHEELKQSISSAGEDIKLKSRSLLLKHLDQSGKELEDISSKVSNDIGESYQKLDNQLDSLEDTLSSTIEKLEQSPMVGITDTSLEEAFASPTGDEVDTRDIAERLSQVWERVRAADFPGARKTWNIVTKDAVNAHIKDMLSRAKSKVTLIIPEPSDIPTSVLTELKSSIGVELVVTESGVLGPSAKPLVGRGNIRVRSRKEKDVFACVRDSEEVLMAPAASVDSDVIGVVSEDDGFVKFVMSIVGPIFQAKTKLLKPEDL